MTFDELAEVLRNMWESAPKGDKSLMVHLFGIRYANELEGMDLAALAELAGLSRSMETEIRKGRNLAQYVAEKQKANGNRTLDELAEKLRSMWDAAPHRGKTPMVHLFGIRYADELEGMDLAALAELAGRPPSMETEIRKGRNLARYVIATDDGGKISS